MNLPAIRTARVPPCRRPREETPRRDAGIGTRRLEEVRVRRSHDVRHHRAGARARDEHAACIALVLAEGPADHVGDGVAVAAAIVREGSGGRDIPAGAGVRGLGVDDDEAVLVCEAGVGCSGVVGGGGAGAVVDCDDDGRVGGEFVGDVNVHLCAGGV